MSRTKHIVIFCLLCSFFFQLTAQNNAAQFTPNKGQWEDHILFKANIRSGNLYLEKNKFTYQFFDSDKIHQIHHGEIDNSTPIDCHAFEVEFLNSHTVSTSADKKSIHYNNFYLGNDRTKWATKVHDFEVINYQEIYSGIDLKLYSSEGRLKYDFIVSPHGNTRDIALKINGAHSSLRNGELIIETVLGEVIEQKPFVYQLINGDKIEVESGFILDNNVVRFSIGNYNTDYELIIDPTIKFSTFSGASSDNWGFTATYDVDKNAYGGGIVFGFDYPVTLGAYQQSFGSGNIDIAISKFNETGVQLLHATFLGGSREESPHSLVVDGNNDLLILGTSGSSDFPMGLNAYQNTFNGGTSVSFGGYTYSNGADIIVTKLSEDGTTLLGSTYVGGTGTDGLNSFMGYNYGDSFRGEIIADDQNNCIVSTVTRSSDFPTQNPTQSTYGGGNSDGCVFKLNQDLSSMIWGTFLGGSDDDAAYSVQFDSNGNVFTAGGTSSSDFPGTATGYNTVNAGGDEGFISKLNNSGSLIRSTYLGTSSYDQVFFVQIDENDFVYGLGQTQGNYPVGPMPVYNNSNSGQFIHKLNNDLTVSQFSTVFGSGSGSPDISPTAFLVDICGYIYVSGWGSTAGIISSGLSTTGLPTLNAYQSTTDGEDFYLIVFDEDAAALQYATFMGGTVASEHVDGGTSRFDKDGTVYQAVCAGCGGTSDFPTTPGVWSTTNNSSNCNLAVFKFDASQLTADISISSQPFVCPPNYDITFTNNSVNATNYFWDFGNGNTSTSNSLMLSHIFDSVGTYTVALVATNPTNTCILSDTDLVVINVVPLPLANIDTVPLVCLGDTTQIVGTVTSNFTWGPNSAPLLDFSSLSTLAVVDSAFSIYLIDQNQCGVDTAFVDISVLPPLGLGVSPDTTICLGDSIQLSAWGGEFYSWTPASFVSNPSNSSPYFSPLANTTFIVEVTDSNNCFGIDSLFITVNPDVPIPVVSNDTLICLGTAVQLFASGGNFYQWQHTSSLDDTNIQNPIATPFNTELFIVSVGNICGWIQDSILIEVPIINSSVSPSQTICRGDTIELWADGGDQYFWSPANFLNDSIGSNVLAFPNQSTIYQVIVQSNICYDTTFTSIDFYPDPTITVGSDVVIPYLSGTEIFAFGNGTFQWNPSNSLDCDTCSNPFANPTETTTYEVVLTNENGCQVKGFLTVFVDGSLFVPNTFTPNGDGVNDLFFAVGNEIKEFEMRVFNRWGQEIFFTNDIDMAWDGKHKGNLSPTGVYVYKINYIENSGKKGKAIGHINLLK